MAICCAPLPDALSLILSLDADFRALYDHDELDEYRLCHWLHAAARRVGVVDAFYVATYHAESQTLHFLYNIDLTGSWDSPDSFPLGNGPTSWVVRNQQTFRLTTTTKAIQRGSVRFGDLTRWSASALHSPMLTSAGEVQGVISMQSYSADAYTDTTQTIFEWLARRGADGLKRLAQDRCHTELTDRLKAQLSQQTTDIGTTLTTLIRELEALATLPTSALATATATLRNYCCAQSMRLAADVHLAGRSSTHSVPQPPRLAASEPDPLAELTPSERRVLSLLVEGYKTTKIADELCVSSHTVKSHLTHIYSKLGVSTARAAIALVLSRQKNHSKG